MNHEPDQRIDYTWVNEKVYAALDVLLSNDRYLLKAGSGGLPLAHKLAEYVQVLFRDWNVDCGFDEPEYQAIAARLGEDHPLPTIIVHRRGTEERLLVIEVSRATDSQPQREQAERIAHTYARRLDFILGLHVILEVDDTLGQPYQVTWIFGLNPPPLSAP